MPDKIIEVPGLGNVSFPDSMSDDQINVAIKKQLAGGTGPSLTPQGTAPTTAQTAQTPGTGLRDLLGTGSNVIGMGASGAQLGAMGGPLGAALGGLLGAGAGALLPPSDSPGTDLGATAGDLIASRLFPGGLNTGRRLARIAGQVGGTGLGAFLGSQGDKALGFQTETPLGRIAVYSALATPGAIAGSLASEASPTMQAAQALKSQTGTEIPLSTAEATGRFGAYEKMLSSGTGPTTTLGQEQDAAARAAVEKIIGAPLNQSLDVVLHASDLGTDARKVMNNWRQAWQTANPKIDVSEVPTGVLDASGNPISKTVTTASKNPVVNWDTFAQTNGLSRPERAAFFQAIRKNPDAFINQFLPGKEDQVKGLLQLRAMMKVFDNSGMQAEAGQLGQAVAMRFLRGTFDLPEAVDGKMLAQRIEGALGSATEPGTLTVALGPQRADALSDLAKVLKDANPLEKVSGDGVSAQKRAGQYLFNKAVFTTASVGTVAAIGSAHNVPIGTLLLGMSGGAVVGIGLPTLIGAVMMNPKLGKVLIAASKGDSAATGRIVRTLGSAKWSEQDRGDDLTASDVTPSAATSRLQGLFSVKK